MSGRRAISSATRSAPVARLAQPAPPTDRTLFYAARRDKLKEIEPGEVVLAFEQLGGFDAVVRPALDDIDLRRR